jgi:hypothetical protein
MARGGDLPAQVDRVTSAARCVSEDVTDPIDVLLFRARVFPLAFMWLVYPAVLALLGRWRRYTGCRRVPENSSCAGNYDVLQSGFTAPPARVAPWTHPTPDDRLDPFTSYATWAGGRPKAAHDAKCTALSTARW